MPIRLSCVVCGDEYVVIPSRAKSSKCCSYRCHQSYVGRKGGAVRGEQVKALSEGKSYVKIKGRHAHRVIMEQTIGRPLAGSEVVHHIDGNKLNNSPTNLSLLPNQAEHMREHRGVMLAARKAKHGY